MAGILRIDEIQELAGISNKELAERTGLTPEYVSAVRNHKKFPREETLVSIANALDVDIRDLFHPTKDNATPLYIKDGEGNLIDVGTLKRTK